MSTETGSLQLDFSKVRTLVNSNYLKLTICLVMGFRVQNCSSSALTNLLMIALASTPMSTQVLDSLLC